MKKILAAVVLPLTFVSLTGCKENSQNKNHLEHSFAFEATTTLNLMNRLQTNRRVAKKQVFQPTETEIQEITQYLDQIDLILSNDNQFSQTRVESDKEEYTYKDVVTFSDFAGNQQSYELYYTSIQEKQKVEEDEIEVKQKIEGIAIMDDLTFNFKCKIESEEEINEKEESITFTLYQSETSYIQVKQEQEQEEDEISNEYRYTIVENEKTIYDYKLKYEEELEDEKLEKSIKLRLNEKTFKIKEEEVNNETFLRVKFVNTQDEVMYSLRFKKIIEMIDEQKTVRYELV